MSIKRLISFLLISQTVFITIVFTQEDLKWSLVHPAKFRDFNGFHFKDENNWIAVGGNLSNDPISTIAVTWNSGSDWNLLEDAVTAQLTDIIFTGNDVAYVTGWKGNLRKSVNAGVSFQPLLLSGVIANRNYNAGHFFTESKGILVGGNFSDDSIQTIIHTMDGGDAWSIVLDQLGPQLNDIQFLDELNGFITGDDRLLLTTDDGGLTWNPVDLTGIPVRNLNSIGFANGVGIIVGGTPTNDSIQTILISDDGGLEWNLVIDQIGPMLNDVAFVSDQWVLAVGNNGVILSSDDLGFNWIKLNISDSINDTVRHLRNITFLNPHLGVLTGSEGKILLYDDNSGASVSMVIANAEVLEKGEIKLSGMVNPDGLEAVVYFEYGVSSLLGDLIMATPGHISGDSLITVEAIVSNIQPDIIYYYRLRVENSRGTFLSQTKQFIEGQQSIPNFSFEFWDSTEIDLLDTWNFIGSVKKVVSFDSSLAVSIKSDDSNPGVILHGHGSDQGLSGGIYYPHRPDTLAGYFRYSIAEDDAALILLQFKDKSGVQVGQNFFTLTGSNEDFELLKFPITYSSEINPDTLILAISSTNALAGSRNPNSILAVDNLYFIGDSVGNIPNGNFESFSSIIEYNPEAWFIQRRDQELTVERSSLALDGNYSIKVNGRFNELSLRRDFEFQKPSFPVQLRHEKLSGAVIFHSERQDSLLIGIVFYENGQPIGQGSVIFNESISTFTPFEITINYFNEGNPDSASINAFIFNQNLKNQLDFESYFQLDNLKLSGLLTDLNFSEISPQRLLVIPNPAHDQILISDIILKEEDLQGLYYKIFDYSGKIYIQSILKDLTIDIADLPSGVYFIQVNSQDQLPLWSSFIKQ